MWPLIRAHLAPASGDPFPKCTLCSVIIAPDMLEALTPIKVRLADAHQRIAGLRERL